VAQETDAEVLENIEQAAEAGDLNALMASVDGLGAREGARVLSRLPGATQARVLTLLPPEMVGDILGNTSDVQAAQFIGKLEPRQAASILNTLYSDDTADVIARLDEDFAEQVLRAMEPEAAEDARLLSQYPRDTAGGLMITEYLAYPASATAADVVRDMRENIERYSGYSVQYTYVTDADGRLVGVLSLRDLLLALAARPLADLMITRLVTVTDTQHLDELVDFFKDRPYLAVPVVNAEGVLLGVVRRTDVEQALGDRAERAFMKTQGIVGGEELRSMPVLLRTRRRLSWLSANIGLNVIAASVIAFYQDTLAQVIALAVFLPILSDMSGCAGSQAVAVSMRELTLGLLKPTEFARVWIKEASVGILNGAALGLFVGAAAWLWQGNPYLGLVVGAALAINTLLGAVIGGSVPLVLKRMNADPALAAGPLLTTITDMCGFLLVLSMAQAMLPWLIS
jgi:magnesium transporter